jgi:hypothetical protein
MKMTLITAIAAAASARTASTLTYAVTPLLPGPANHMLYPLPASWRHPESTTNLTGIFFQAGIFGGQE